MKTKSDQNSSFLCFGGEDWWYHNRGHIDFQLMRRFAKMGTTLYVNSIVMQKPSLKKATAGGKSFTQKFMRKLKSLLRGLRKVDVGFWVYSPLSLPLHHVAWLRCVNGAILRTQLYLVSRKLGIDKPLVWVACPAACDVAVRMKKVRLVYQRTDRYEEYPNVNAEIIAQYDRKLKAQADLTIYANRKLFQQERSQSKKAIYLDHGVDYELFASAEKVRQIPDDIAQIKRPIVGFFGGIDSHTSDIPFLEKVVKLLPEVSFVLVGEASSNVTKLQEKKNIWMLGQKPYEQIPHYGKCFDVCIMPWRQNRWIQACNPIKLKEYLALGKPVVSTPFTELQKYLDVVYIAKSPEDFAHCIERALVEDNLDRIDERRKKVKNNTWDTKAQAVLDELFGSQGTALTTKKDE